MTTPIPLKTSLGVSVLGLLIPIAISALRSDPPPPPAPPVVFRPPPIPHAPLCAKGRTGDLIDCLICCDPPDKTLRDDGRLTKGDIIQGMSKIKPAVQACYEQYRVPGFANVLVSISTRGQVTHATVFGSFAGTRTGACVAKTVRAASFPPSTQAETINYPFMLR